MNPLTTWLRSLGNAGAVTNAWRACEDRRLDLQRVEALSTRLEPAQRAAS
jgi:hypothetical protein